MKRLLIFFFLSFFSLYAEEEKTYWQYHPLHVGGNAIWVGKAEVEDQKTDKKRGHLNFQKENAYVVLLVPVSHTSYFFPRIEWNTFVLDWNENPKFNQTRFYYWQFGLTFYTIAIEKWRWILRADYNLDTKHFSHPGSYGLLTSLLWGSYQIHRKWHYHIGALGYVGIQGDQIYPVIGFDFAPNKKWFFQAIFPIVYSIDYNLDRWRFSLRGRPLRERFRSGNSGAQPHSIFSYSTMGCEFNVRYEIIRKFEFEIYGGYNLGGSFYIKDRAGRKPLYTAVQGAPYAGVNLDYGF